MNKTKSLLLVVIGLLGAVAAHAQAALPTGYTQISTDATSTFGWAKEFAIGVIVFGFIVSLVRLARKR